jgi:CDP-4-dehydro-6-deoxyglucose reductase
MTQKCTEAEIVRITPLTNSILQLILAPTEYINYHAGQYLQILSNNEAFSYSIANAPLGSHKYELHIRHSRDNPYNQPLLADIKQRGRVTLSLPLGACDLHHINPELPIIFIAQGTGFAPIKAMIEQLLADGESRPFELFWGARSQSDLYMEDKVLLWQAHVDNFAYFSQLSDFSKTSLATLVLKRHRKDIQDWQIIIAGPFDLAYTSRTELVAGGAVLEHLYSDAFSFEGET